MTADMIYANVERERGDVRERVYLLFFIYAAALSLTVDLLEI